MRKAASRTQRFIKWTCAACAVMLAATIIITYFRYIVFQAPHLSTLLVRGRFGIGTSRLHGVPVRESVHFMAYPIEPRGEYLPGFDSYVTLDGWNMVVIPLWLPFSLTFLAALVLFIRQRPRRAAGLCRKCGYDLTGNESGVCPECGTKVDEETSD